MANLIEQLTQMLIFSAVMNALLLGLLIYIAAMSRPVLTHFIAKILKQPLLLVWREDGRWAIVRGKLKHGFVTTKDYGDFIAINDAFRPLAGVPLAIVHTKIGFTLPERYVRDVTLLKKLGAKLKNVVDFRNRKDAPGYEVEKVNNYLALNEEVDEETKRMLELSDAIKRANGFLLNVKDTFEYLIYNLNPINLRARVNARVMEELASRQKTEPLKYAFAFMIVILGLVFGLIMLDVWFGHPSGNVAQQVQSTVDQIVPISISKGP